MFVANSVVGRAATARELGPELQLVLENEIVDLLVGATAECVAVGFAVAGAVVVVPVDGPEHVACSGVVLAAAVLVVVAFVVETLAAAVVAAVAGPSVAAGAPSASASCCPLSAGVSCLGRLGVSVFAAPHSGPHRWRRSSAGVGRARRTFLAGTFSDNHF